MKFSTAVSSDRNKSRKAHFTAHSEARRKIMSSTLSKDLRAQLGVRALPLRKDDEVKVLRGKFKGRDGKVTNVYRKKFVVHVDRIQREKGSGVAVPVGLHPSNLAITKLKQGTGTDREKIIKRKQAGYTKTLAVRGKTDRRKKTTVAAA